MGKSKDPKMKTVSYNLSLHMGICVGPAELLEIIVGEKSAWTGHKDEASAFAINARDLFGGMKKEGGIAGMVTFLPGADDQKMPDAIAQRFGRADRDDCPAFRGMASIAFTNGSLWGTTSVSGDYLTPTVTHGKAKPGSAKPGFYWGTNTPYLKGVWARMRRSPFARDADDIGLDHAIAMIPRFGAAGETPTYVTYRTETVNVNAVTDGAATAAGGLATGITLSDFSPTDVLTITQPSGGTYTAWSPWGAPSPANAPGHTGSTHKFNVIEDGDTGTDQTLGILAFYDGYEAARAAFTPVQLTGASSYTFYIYDTPVGDNSGGVSLHISAARLVGGRDANPAHMIYESLVNTDWGMGGSASLIDVESFVDASEILYIEGFGLSMIWTRQSRIEDFVTEILDHINATIFVSPATGLLTLKLIRADYDIELLPEATPDNAKLSKFQRKAFGEIINEIVVTWTNPVNEQEETVTFQDLGMIAAQNGEVISDGRNYYGARSRELAAILANRDLRQAAFPMATCDAEFNRSLWNITPGMAIKVNWPEHGVSELVMRVGAVDYGKVGDSKIKCSLVEDVFSYLTAEYEEPAGSEWEDPSTAPTPMDYTRVITLPLYMALLADSALPDTAEYPEVLAGVLASSASADTFAYELYAETVAPDGTEFWESYGANTALGRATLVADMPAEVTSDPITFTTVIGGTQPGVSVFAFIGGLDTDEEDMEIALISESFTPGAFLLKRGVLDTVPLDWPAGTPVTFVVLGVDIDDPTVRSDGEVVDYKLLSRTSLGTLAEDEAPLLSGTLTGRPHYPNRPADVQVEGVAFLDPGEEVDASDNGETFVAVTWANRNRLLEDNQVLAWDDATMTPEDGQTTTITILDPADRSVVHTEDDLAGTSYNLPKADFGALPLGIVRVTSKRDGFESLTGHELIVKVKDITLDMTTITLDSTQTHLDET